MSPLGDNPPQYNLPPNAHSFLYQRQRSRIQEKQSLQARAHSQAQHDLGRRDPYGEKLARIYPQELRKSPGAAARYASPSSPHPVTSPLLSALTSTTNTATQYTSDWAKSLPFFPSPHPGSIAGSPPSQIPIRSGRDPISTSPPGMKPKSHPNNAYPSFGARQQQQPQQARDRRASMYSQYGYRGHAPQPHEDQAHFHPGGLPDLDSIGVPSLAQVGGLSAGENGYFCGWDTLSAAGHGPSAGAENVLLVGYEGGLRMYRVSRKSVDVIGRIEGLRGGVIGARILPWTSRKDPGGSSRPYVALIIHGPVLEEPTEHNSSDESAAVSAEESSPEPSAHPSSRPSSSRGLNVREIIKRYQTTVEVFSLSTSKHVATLYSSPIVTEDCADLMTMNEYVKPPPIGDLKVDANGKFMVVASGVSGEIFIFSPYTKQRGKKELEHIRCVGKLWTSVQPRETKKPTGPNEPLDSSNSSDDAECHRGIPLFSLSNRWIATVPPQSTALYSLTGTAHLLESIARPPGLTTHYAPPPPPTSCAVDIPEGSDFMSRMSREVTQSAIKGAKWVSEQGMQAWKNYWNQPVPLNGTGYNPPQQLNQPRFPPTHDYSNATPTASNDPTQIAVFDLQRFLDVSQVIDGKSVKGKNGLTPLATFELPSGCSFLSFAPSGLHMVTVSKKGDEQFVWSMMKMRDPRSAIPGAPKSASGPYVRQIKKFSRMTTANTVDIVWSAPHGERFSILTERGTIHAHEIPASVFQWPPQRRARRVQKTPHERPVSPKGRLTSAVDAISGASTWLKSARAKGLSGTVVAVAPAGMSSKALKAGMRTSLGVVANSAQAVYHAGENKLHLASIVAEAMPGCMRWMTGRDKGSLAIVAAGTVYIYTVKQTTKSRKGQPPLLGARISKKPTEFNIHPIPNDQFAPALRNAVEARINGIPLSDANAVTGQWQLRSPPSAYAAKLKHRPRENWHAMVESETTPPYQPFHTDRRVSLYAFADPPNPTSTPADNDFRSPENSQCIAPPQDYTTDILAAHLKSHHHINDDTPWLFGLEVSNLRVIREGRGGGSADGLWDEEDMDIVRMVDSGADGDQVVVTTVRRRGREDEDFFEDGCEVLDFAEDRV